MATKGLSHRRTAETAGPEGAQGEREIMDGPHLQPLLLLLRQQIQPPIYLDSMWLVALEKPSCEGD
jgi:hypothetical protein